MRKIYCLGLASDIGYNQVVRLKIITFVICIYEWLIELNGTNLWLQKFYFIIVGAIQCKYVDSQVSYIFNREIGTRTFPWKFIRKSQKEFNIAKQNKINSAFHFFQTYHFKTSSKHDVQN